MKPGQMYFLNYHYGSVSIHARKEAQILVGDGDAANPALRETIPAEFINDARAHHVLFITHGFNVSYAEGARSLGRLGKALAQPENVLVVGVLWPGDFYIPAVNYPAASIPAMESGQALAALCNASLRGASSLSFVSHSLGARVVLEAVAGLTNRKARFLCVTAGAVNDDCLTTEYARAVTNTEPNSVYTMASVNDEVLRLAYPVGDLIGQLLADDHGLFQEALGRHGPNPAAPAYPLQIPGRQGYGHHNYLPSSAQTLPAPSPDPLADQNKWVRVRDFIVQAYGGKPNAWPPPLG
jgi:hypothetical protein